MSDERWEDPVSPAPPPKRQERSDLAVRLAETQQKRQIGKSHDRHYASKTLWRRSNPISILREEKGITVAELAEAVGCSKSHLYKCNSGVDRISSELCTHIAKHLDVSPGPLYLAYIEWLAMEPTVHRKEIRRMSLTAMKKCNPVFQALKGMGHGPEWLCAVSGMGINTCNKLCSDPDMSPTTRTLKRAANYIGMDHVDLYRKWSEWSEHFRHLNFEDRIVAALEYEGMEEDDL